MLGAIELRAHAAENSNDLARIGVRLAIDDHRPRELLAQLEATRRTVSLLPAARPPDDEVLAELLTELRVVAAQQRAAIEGGSPDGDLARRRRALEASHPRSPAAGPGRAPRAATSRSTSPCGCSATGPSWSTPTSTDGCTPCRWSVAGPSMHDLGPIDGLVPDIDGCSHALHRLNRAQGSAASRAAAATSLGVLTGALAERLIPRRVLRSQRPVVVVPTGILYALPWGCPARADRDGPCRCARRSRAGRSPSRRRPGPAAGSGWSPAPELAHADDEVAALAEIHDAPVVLAGEAATAARALELIGRCDLVHLACHGAYRHDNPLFSTLRLADGTLTVFDLERCAALPRTVVLSACNVAMDAAVGGGALLGLASSLMTFGAGTVDRPADAGLRRAPRRRDGPSPPRPCTTGVEPARGARPRRRQRRRPARPDGGGLRRHRAAVRPG